MPCLSAQDCVEPQIGGRKPERAAALLAVDHLARHEPWRAEQFRGLDHLPRRERGADRAGRHRAALVLERRHDIHRKAELGALLAQEIRRAGAVLAEMEIEADRRAADA